MTIAERWIIEDSPKYAGLTVQEKARKAVEEMGATGQITKVAWMMEIEKALTAQIEECAKKADEHEAMETERAKESDRNGKGLSQLGHVFEATAAKTIAENIRALAEPKPETEGKGDQL